MQLIHHRHSLVLLGAGHVPASVNHRFLVASAIVPTDGTWTPAQEVIGEHEARISYPNGFWLQVLPSRATFCQEAALPVGDPRTVSLAEFGDIAEGYHETFSRVTHQAVGLNVDLMLDAAPQAVLPSLLADPGRWLLGDDAPFETTLMQRYRLPDGVLTITLHPAVVTPPAPARPQPKLAVSANAEIELADGLSRALLRRLLERLPVYREMVLVLIDQLAS